MLPESYVSIDIESNGPIPGPNSMWSLGTVAFDSEGVELTTFYVTLQDLPGSSGEPSTMRWWAKQGSAFAAARKDPIHPLLAMNQFVYWTETSVAPFGPPCTVAYPATFDFMFVYWYMMRFCSRSPYGFQCIDIKSLAMASLGTPWRSTTKKRMPKAWFDKSLKHTHHALDDAREQGRLFFEIRRHLDSLRIK